MSSVNNFLDKENVQLLWEVLIDEPLIKEICNSELKNKELVRIFETNIRDFYIREKNNCINLIELNKKYVLLIINFVMKINNLQKSDTTNQYKKIKIHSEEPKQSITFEEIQNDRKIFFDKELSKKQEEFTNAMTLPIPPVPNFSDNLDQPISEIEIEIKKIKEQRNYDIEMINNTNKNSTSSFNEDWLKPKETSIKNEKLTNNKHITWKDDIQEESVINEEINIFDKFKKISNTDLISDKQQIQIDEIRKEIFALNEKMDLILQRFNN